MTVAEYLKLTGGAELKDICRDLKLTPDEARKQLKAAGAHDRKYGDWPKTKPDGSSWGKWDYGCGGPACPKPFTLWHLRHANVIAVQKAA